MKINVFKNIEKLSNGLALWMSELINSTLQTQEYFTLVLSGGETPKSLFKKLVSAEFKDKFDWKRIHIFWGDERAVPFTDERNNAKVAFELLIDHIDIPAENVHAMRTDIEPVFAAKEYDKILHHYFTNTIKSFDLVLLGMGDDGHTLSLFPGSDIIEETDADDWVKAVYNEEQKMFRITLMPSIVNLASNTVFMIEGAKKADILKQVIEGDYTPLQLPSQIIKPSKGELYWFIDEAAAKKLNKL